MIWSKNTKCGFLWSRHQTLRSHELILRFTRPGEFRNATYNPQRTPGNRMGTRSINRKSGGVYGSVQSHLSVRDGWVHPSSVLNFDSDRGNNQGTVLHPTQKPLALMQWLVESFTNEGDTVIDPFMGAGTTALACARTNRRFIGIEKESHYFDLAIKRLQSPRTASLIEDEPPYLFQSRPTDNCKTDESQVHASNRRI